VIPRGANFATQICGREQLGSIAKLLQQKSSALRQTPDVTWFRRKGESATPIEITGDLLFGDQPFDQPHGIERQLKHAFSAISTDPPSQLLHFELVSLQHEPAVATAGAPAKMMLFEHGYVRTPAGKHAGGRKSGVATTDDRDICDRGKLSSGSAGKRYLIGP
jgi:hypothetical protein